MITEEVKKYIDRSVLCWLATVDRDGDPNVSPKEVFAAYENDRLVIANIASAGSMRNILSNDAVCV
ncbi:pyridoxamine 5'-phosphate oxidase family protein [Halomonas sp. GD1P12]|uniref:pyridoxamine 5'-phosphate oxidase family protein n=1 Tax=Halomonas sp. GD1P12 TaxID=2982691 RepID=UPI0021E430B0|nr:pyridoxamine 5'-phosphate oxidase family protein [Halomonas sp. GD1P12]UYG01261.1 pyridoxamine 5'-phosphate oxidase family protein [Halomonas sp. GD1P12]